jgi:uncharacterized protein
MAVIAMWRCDRDGSMFANKKDAEAYDAMLELADNFAAFIEARATGVGTEEAEAIGLLLAQNKEQIIAACKGKPEGLAELASDEAQAEADTKKSDNVVTPIASNG